MARDGIEPPTHGASIHCSTNWATEPNYCGSRIWTYDLRVMSPTSYRAAPSRANNIKGGCGIRTHARFYTPDGFQDRSLQPDLGNPPYYIIVRTGFEPVLPPWKGGVLTPWPTDHINKWAQVDSNHRPHAYQACALTSWAMRPRKTWVSQILIKRVTRIELATTAWKAVVLPLNYTRI